ncbi:MAG: tetratricopeptide (TPR) repeat protein [Verrucomicrobiales bacterium]|jgi:tetratricopeptide (TPR) repeat protein
MTDFPKSQTRQLLRRTFALALIAFGIWLAFPPRPPIAFIASLALFIVATGLLLKELLWPFTWMVDAFFGTGAGEGGKPPLDLRLAQFYVKEGRFEEALEEYLRVMKFHPYVAETWEQAILMTAKVSPDRAKVDRLFRRALRKLRNLEDQAAIRAAYDRAKEELGSQAA